MKGKEKRVFIVLGEGQFNSPEVTKSAYDRGILL